MLRASMFQQLLQRTAVPAIFAEVRGYIQATSRKTFVGLLVAPILMTLVLRLGIHPIAQQFFSLFTSAKLDPIYHWYFVFVVQFILMYWIPVAIIKGGFRENLTDYGHQARPLLRLWPLILIFLAIMLPVTYVSSQQPSFSTYYPLYQGASRGWREFIVFEAGIFVLFWTQEFFFRGFLIEVLKPSFGHHAIMISTALYGVTHYAKPLPEQMGAFFVGLLLGYLGDRYRTFYFGVIIHYLIAFSMDAYLVIPRLLGRSW